MHVRPIRIRIDARALLRHGDRSGRGLAVRGRGDRHRAFTDARHFTGRIDRSDIRVVGGPLRIEGERRPGFILHIGVQLQCGTNHDRCRRRRHGNAVDSNRINIKRDGILMSTVSGHSREQYLTVVGHLLHSDFNLTTIIGGCDRNAIRRRSGPRHMLVHGFRKDLRAKLERLALGHVHALAGIRVVLLKDRDGLDRFSVVLDKPLLLRIGIGLRQDPFGTFKTIEFTLLRFTPLNRGTVKRVDEGSVRSHELVIGIGDLITVAI